VVLLFLYVIWDLLVILALEFIPERVASGVLPFTLWDSKAVEKRSWRFSQG